MPGRDGERPPRDRQEQLAPAAAARSSAATRVSFARLLSTAFLLPHSALPALQSGKKPGADIRSFFAPKGGAKPVGEPQSASAARRALDSIATPRPFCFHFPSSLPNLTCTSSSPPAAPKPEPADGGAAAAAPKPAAKPAPSPKPPREAAADAAIKREAASKSPASACGAKSGGAKSGGSGGKRASSASPSVAAGSSGGGEQRKRKPTVIDLEDSEEEEEAAGGKKVRCALPLSGCVCVFSLRVFAQPVLMPSRRASARFPRRRRRSSASGRPPSRPPAATTTLRST